MTKTILYDPNSAKTAITRTSISAPTKYLYTSGLLIGDVIDFGCGKGFDAVALCLDKYDPYYFPELPAKKYNTLISIYVLNVVEPTHVPFIIEEAMQYLDVGGTGYFAVRRDIKNEGITKKGTKQYNIILPLPLIYENSKFAIYSIIKGGYPLGRKLQCQKKRDITDGLIMLRG